VTTVDQLTLQRGKKLSISAWSKHEPTDPIDARIPSACSLLPNAKAGELRSLIRMVDQPIADQAAAPHPKLHRGESLIGEYLELIAAFLKDPETMRAHLRQRGIKIPAQISNSG